MGQGHHRRHIHLDKRCFLRRVNPVKPAVGAKARIVHQDVNRLVELLHPFNQTLYRRCVLQIRRENRGINVVGLHQRLGQGR